MRKLFQHITLSQLHSLCKTVAESEFRQKSYIQQKYSDIAIRFDETLSFAEDIEIIKNNLGELNPLTPLSTFTRSVGEFKIYLLQKLFCHNGEVSDQLKEFLLNFELKTDQFLFNATLADNIKFSDIRDLLLELEFISPTAQNDGYVVNSNYANLFLQQITQAQVSADAFKRNQEAKGNLGLAAELEIIAFEKKRLINTSIRPDEIEHTSQINVFAGFDVKSFENYLDKDSNQIVRYIEVKAVSLSDYKFYWSRNEIEKARIFRERYYLYLLPVKSNHIFDIDNMLMICDPVKNVYENQLEWEKDEESICVSTNSHRHSL